MQNLHLARVARETRAGTVEGGAGVYGGIVAELENFSNRSDRSAEHGFG
jgi:hypothetical protein